jgi:hypothetical protein
VEYHTPGVYIREVDSGPKPISSVSTSTPGFLGLFEFHPPHDAIAITGSNGKRQLRGKVVPQLVDEKGAVKGDANEATTALSQAFKLGRKDVRDVKKYFELHGAAKAGPSAPKFEAGTKGKVKITWGEKTLEVPEVNMSVDGKVVTESDESVEKLLNSLHETFPLEKAAPKTAGDVLSVYGYDVKGTEGTALRSEYSVPPVGITNKAEFFLAPELLRAVPHRDPPHRGPRRPHLHRPRRGGGRRLRGHRERRRAQEGVPRLPLPALRLQLRGRRQRLLRQRRRQVLRLPHGLAGPLVLDP